MKKGIFLLFMLLSIGLFGQVNPDGSIKTPPDQPNNNPRQQTQTRRTTTSSIGIGIDLGGLIRSLKNKKNCNQLKIVFPTNKSKFIAKISAHADGSFSEVETAPTKPSFRWTSSKPELVDYYIVELVRTDKKEKISIYQAETNETFFIWPEDLPFEASGNGNDGEQVKWEFFVMAVINNRDKCQNALASTSFEITNEVITPSDKDESNVEDETTLIKKGKAGKALADTVKRNSTKQNQDDIILISPLNNQNFSLDQIPDFKWRTNKVFDNPSYKLSIYESVGNENSDRKLVFEKEGIVQTELSSSEITPNLQKGKTYTWMVIESQTGISSPQASFSVNDCAVVLQISNENIECLGFEGNLRKYKICFSSSYLSPNGPLTFNNSGSGLFVYDQNNNLLQLSAPPNLQTQPSGGTPSTVTYCFEVLVPPGVSSIGFGLQGDDLDSSPLICQPGASLLIDELPNCLCDDCNAVQTDISNFTSNTQPNSIVLSGSLTTNVPIYGIEVQVVSYSYSAQPSACTVGVANLEQSGMILLGQSLINNSNQIQAYSLLGTPNNTQATKAIKYMSNGPMNGNIPIQLNMGLPMPLAGLDSGCCTINYRVCLQFKIYTERGLCKSCVFEKCIDFTN